MVKIWQVRPTKIWLIAFITLLGLWFFWPSQRFESTQQRAVFQSPYQNLSDWPRLDLPLADPAVEKKVSELLARMTLEQKVAQMTQAEIQHIRPNDIERYGIGAVLNGGGSWPKGYPTLGLSDWLALADQFWLASQESDLGIPILWGTDAVHGHNNVMGATMFPHNIGLGATANISLVESIAEITAQQVLATGLDWVFAPTVAIAQNPRWGRFYESFSQDADAAYYFGYAAVKGLQTENLSQGVIATVKHFIADGATNNGQDQGNARISEQALMNIHAQGYYGALEAGAQAVMVSFSSVKGLPMHSHHYLVTEVLKQKMGFDGIVLSDWDGIKTVSGCRYSMTCSAAINAGIDMVMVPKHWRGFIEETVRAVRNGEISEQRIDDAVSRILRVKFRAGLFEKPMPSARGVAGDDTLLNSDYNQTVARQAVQQSLVLLKNNQNILPLDPSGVYVIAGDYNKLARQHGGWSLSWQGGEFHEATFFPGATTILDGALQLTSAKQGSVVPIHLTHTLNNSPDAIIVVISEPSYAEKNGDYLSWVGLLPEHQAWFGGLDMHSVLAQQFPSVPVVTVYLGGRPLLLNEVINHSEAFVVAWLPGSQAAGVADGLFGVSPFTGTLPVNWPGSDCIGKPYNSKTALFPIGYGLSTDDQLFVPKLPSGKSLTLGSLGLAPACVWNNLVSF